MKNNVIARPGKLSAFLVCLCLSLATVTVPAKLDISDQQLQKYEQKYGADAAKRMKYWRELIETSQSLSEEEKLKAVNNYFNQTILFINDIDHWGKEDYWATPFECLGTGAGDCEDFSVAKYFTLRELGVPDEKLRLTYVKAVQYNQAHMVCTYFTTPTAVPLVLDNLIGTIEPATNRKDLLPVYSFNGTGLWLAKERGGGKQVSGGAERIAMWQELKNRMVADTIN